MENNAFHKTKIEKFLESLNKDTRNEDKERNNTIFGIFVKLKEMIHSALSNREGTCGALHNELNMIVSDAVKIELSLSERYKSLDKYEVMEYREACFLLSERLHLCLYGKGNYRSLLRRFSILEQRAMMYFEHGIYDAFLHTEPSPNDEKFRECRQKYGALSQRYKDMKIVRFGNETREDVDELLSIVEDLEELLKETSSIRTTFNKELRMKEEHYWNTYVSDNKRKFESTLISKEL